MKTVHEISAGAIIFHQFKQTKYFLVLLYHGGYWDFPKGHQEPGETLERTALREIYEETGLGEIIIHKDQQTTIEYTFSRTEELVQKKVVLFAAETLPSHRLPLLTISFEHRGYAWITFDEALVMLHYASARSALKTLYGTLPKQDSI